MRIELISEDIYSFAEVISEYETSVLTVKLRGRIRAISSLIRGGRQVCINYIPCDSSNLCLKLGTLHASQMCIVAIHD